MSVVGIDFGATNAVIAAAGRGGVDVILNGNSNRLNPCMVGFGDSRSMGEQAGATATSNYKNTISHMKRLVGLAFDDPRAQKEMARLPFTCVPLSHASGGPDSIAMKVNFSGEEKIVPVEAIAGMMVKHLGTIAAEKAATESSSNMDLSDHKTIHESFFPRDWVVAIPGYYTDAQRRAFLHGCEIAGIPGVQRLMHENTATALAYGIFKDIRKEFKKDEPTNVMFIDMGSTAYSVSIAAFEPGKLIVKSAFYDTDIGGRDFDALIAESIASQFEAKYKGKLSDKPMNRPKTKLKLLSAAEKAKKTLSPQGVKEARVNLECLMDDFDFNCSIKADEYEQMCQPILDRLAGPIEKALEEAGLKVDDLASVEIVGGSTRIGCLKRKITSILGGKDLSTTMNADEAVARGAALQSAILSPRFKVLPYEIQESQPLPIQISWDEEIATASQQGMEVEGDADAEGVPETNSVVMFDRGLNFPIVRRVTLRRMGDFTVTAAYDESAKTFDLPEGVSADIATFKISAPAGDEKKVRVNVKEDIHGIINLSSAQMVEEIEEEEPAAKEEGEKKEGEDEAAAAAKEGEEKKKKKIKKTNLDFTVTRPLDWTKEEKDKFFESEVSMSNTDRIVRETSDMRNELESYIYDMRDKIISESQLASYCTEDEKSAFSTSLENSENWLYEDGFDANKTAFADKLAELKKLGDPIDRRQTEAAGRPTAVAALQKNIEKYKSWLNVSQGDEKFAHITDEEREKCHSTCDETSSWLYEMLDKQGSLAQNEDPVVTVAQIQTKNNLVSNICSPIKHKPAPKPKKEEKKTEEKPAAASTEGETKEASSESDEKKTGDDNNSSGGEPMETEDTAAEKATTEEGGEPMDVDKSVD